MRRTIDYYTLEKRVFLFKVWPEEGEAYTVEVEAKHERVAKAQMQKRYNCYEFKKFSFIGVKK